MGVPYSACVVSHNRVGRETMKYRAVILALSLCAAAFQADAQLSGQPMKFTFHDPCGGGNAASCGTVMVGQGEFNEQTVPAFIAALKDFAIESKNPVLGQFISRVIISSPGGSLAAGLQLGTEIWAAAGSVDTLLRWKMKLEVGHGNKKEIQPGVQIRGCQAG